MKCIKATVFLAILIGLPVTLVFAQKGKMKPVVKVRPIIFAVISDGSTVEPITYVEKGKLVQPVSGGEDPAKLVLFNKTYYKPDGIYRLIFGGVNAGTVTIKSSDPKAECSANMAEVASVSAKAKLKGNVMALATNAVAAKKSSGVRRLPTAAERSEIEALVRTNLIEENVPQSNAKVLKYQNLTAVDVDSDGVAEMVGTFWAETSATSRALLFFIADKNSDGKYAFGFGQFQNMKQEDVMSGEISSVDSGVYHERLLDIFDYDDDGVAEIFTYTQSFEGAGFSAYRREGRKWVQAFEGSNYHCGY
ncbi:MAG: hypothetical protein ABIU09_04415 [Pyrinomonadaceae bacterium]